jgi:hypothetical protein
MEMSHGPNANMTRDAYIASVLSAMGRARIMAICQIVSAAFHFHNQWRY